MVGRFFASMNGHTIGEEVATSSRCACPRQPHNRDAHHNFWNIVLQNPHRVSAQLKPRSEHVGGELRAVADREEPFVDTRSTDVAMPEAGVSAPSEDVDMVPKAEIPLEQSGTQPALVQEESLPIIPEDIESDRKETCVGGQS